MMPIEDVGFWILSGFLGTALLNVTALLSLLCFVWAKKFIS